MKSSILNIYKSNSPIPYIITLQVAVFLILTFTRLFISPNIFLLFYDKLSLPSSFKEFIYQPFSLLTYAFVYDNILELLFDCLWLYWVSNMFLNILTNRHFLFIFSAGIIVGAIVFLIFSSILPWGITLFPLTSINYAIVSVLTANLALSPQAEIRLMLSGIVKLKVIVLVYVFLYIFFFLYNKEYTNMLGFIAATGIGFLYIKSLQSGHDWSNLLKQKKRLKVIQGQKNDKNKNNNLPNQDVIDKILDKISINGYDSLTKQEKETLFKMSKEDQ